MPAHLFCVIPVTPFVQLACEEEYYQLEVSYSESAHEEVIHHLQIVFDDFAGCFALGLEGILVHDTLVRDLVALTHRRFDSKES